MKKFFWIDLEMTGLDENADHLLEVAIVITDLDLNPLEEFHRIIYQPPEIIAKMNDWCKKTHGESGLTSAIEHGTPLKTVEVDILALITRHYKHDDRIVLAGNSVGNDRRFIDHYFPTFAQHLHYRVIDVSTLKEIFRDKYHLPFAKKNAHRAIGDIHESIRELAFYLSYVKVPTVPDVPAKAPESPASS